MLGFLGTVPPAAAGWSVPQPGSRSSLIAVWAGSDPSAQVQLSATAAQRLQFRKLTNSPCSPFSLPYGRRRETGRRMKDNMRPKLVAIPALMMLSLGAAERRDSYRSEVEDWRAKHQSALARDYGWLTVVG